MNNSGTSGKVPIGISEVSLVRSARPAMSVSASGASAWIASFARSVGAFLRGLARVEREWLRFARCDGERRGAREPGDAPANAGSSEAIEVKPVAAASPAIAPKSLPETCAR